MDKQNLSKFSKEKLINLLLKQNTKIQQLKNKISKPTKVQQLAQSFENNIIPPPLEFRDDYKPVPKPRTIKRPVPTPRKSVKQMVQNYEKNIIPPIPKPRTIKTPVPLPRTKIEQVAIALKGYTKSFEILQLQLQLYFI